VVDTVPQGVVSARLSWNNSRGNKAADVANRSAGNVNALTSDAVADIAGGATFYSNLVEVRKVSW